MPCELFNEPHTNHSFGPNSWGKFRKQCAETRAYNVRLLHKPAPNSQYFAGHKPCRSETPEWPK